MPQRLDEVDAPLCGTSIEIPTLFDGLIQVPVIPLDSLTNILAYYDTAGHDVGGILFGRVYFLLSCHLKNSAN